MKTIEILGFPIDLGADTRGVDMGPSALRIADITERISDLGYNVIDFGNLVVPISAQLSISNPRMKYVDEILAASEILAIETEAILNRGNFPLILGGDHSMAVGSIAGIASHCRNYGKRLGVVWFDAHSDMNTDETTPSGNVHGMSLAANLGLGHPSLTHLRGFSPKLVPQNVALVGIRNVDRQESITVRESGVEVFNMSDVDRIGIFPIVSSIVERFSKTVDHLHISFDLDCLDPDLAPGVGTPVPGGLSFREAHLFMEIIASSGLLASMEITEVNPILDVRNKTANLAVNLLESALGKRIM